MRFTKIMATKKTVKKEEVIEKEAAAKPERYFYAVGKRKTAVAQVRIYPVKKASEFTVNDKELDAYFPISRLSETAKAPLAALGQAENFDVTVKVAGGGVNAQAEALQLGVARALVKFDETLKKSLRDREMLTRDSRVVERKKPGKLKARRSPQWAKR